MHMDYWRGVFAGFFGWHDIICGRTKWDWHENMMDLLASVMLPHTKDSLGGLRQKGKFSGLHA